MYMQTIYELAGITQVEWERIKEDGQREAMVNTVGELAVQLASKCHDSRCRDSIRRMYEDFQNRAGCNKDFEAVKSSFTETMEDIDRMYDYDQSRKDSCEACIV